MIKPFPEIDKAGWFDLASAAVKINAAQVDFLMQVATITQVS